MVEPQDRIPAGGEKGLPCPGDVDLRGLKCPLPALRTEKAVANLPPGGDIAVLADDPLARLDIAHLCRRGGHALLASEPLAGGGWRFRIRRSAG